MLDFSKFENDSLKAINQLLNKDITPNIINYQSLNLLLSPLLEELIKSYYFKKQYQNYEFSNHTIHTYEDTVDIKMVKHKEEVYPEFILFKDELEKSYANNKKMDFSKLTLEEIKNQFTIIDPFYKVIFEKDPLIQKLNLLNKNDIVFDWVYVNDDLSEILKSYHTIESNNSLDKYKFEDHLNENCGLEYINFMCNKNRYFLIAHNNKEIAGITSIPNDSSYKDIQLKDNIKFVSYISVSESFRGQSLGQQMFQEVIKKANEENWIIVRSSPSSNGVDFLQSKIDKLVENTNNVLIINHDNMSSYFSELKNIFNSIKSPIEFKNKSNQCIEYFHKINKLCLDCSKSNEKKSYEDVMININERNIHIKDLITDLKNKLSINKRIFKCSIN